MALSIDLRERVASAYEAGNGSYEELAENFGVAICSVRRWVALLRETGSVRKRSAPGAVPRIKDCQLVELVQLVEEKPDRGLNESVSGIRQSQILKSVNLPTAECLTPILSLASPVLEMRALA